MRHVKLSNLFILIYNMVYIKRCTKVRFYYPAKVTRGSNGDWEIPVAILPSCQYMKIIHYDYIQINIVG